MGENTQTNGYICPLCGKSFASIHEYATHMSQHSQDEKKREAEEEKRRLEDQKKVDVEKLEKLKKAYQAAQEEYIAAKEKFEEKYGNETTTFVRFPFYIEDWDRLMNELNNHYWGR